MPTSTLSALQFLKSKTIWATAAMFIFNGIQGSYHVVSPDQASTINLFLGGLIAAARVSNGQGNTLTPPASAAPGVANTPKV